MKAEGGAFEFDFARDASSRRDSRDLRNGNPSGVYVEEHTQTQDNAPASKPKTKEKVRGSILDYEQPSY